MPSLQCTLCYAVASKNCTGCRATIYCGRECQGRDWPIHKMLCTGYQDFLLSRPSIHHRAAILLPTSSTAPKFVWVELTYTYGDAENNTAFYPPEFWRAHLDADPTPANQQLFQRIMQGPRREDTRLALLHLVDNERQAGNGLKFIQHAGIDCAQGAIDGLRRDAMDRENIYGNLCASSLYGMGLNTVVNGALVFTGNVKMHAAHFRAGGFPKYRDMTPADMRAIYTFMMARFSIFRSENSLRLHLPFAR
ncbi:hypothetical protein PVAG01_08863 [Phlyctema vagabunda]|uniref:MYND-type domain-containing protein n=1 Tax=Phlyctema vagabunda TaxID=108571 RepID=A0ABR4PAM1_9HELO